MTVHYRLAPEPTTHLYHVTLTITDPDPAGQVLSLPAWIPGSYMIRDFAKNIVRIAAEANGPVRLTKRDKHTWQAAPCDGPLTVRYEVYAWDLSVRGAHLDTTHGYFNGTSVFLCVHGQQAAPCTVDLVAPAGGDYGQWQIATTLQRDGASPHGFGGYRAADYDELIDHPVEMGAFTLAFFEAAGVPHEVAITGRHRADTARLTRDLQQVCEYHIGLFGTPAPMDRYLFQVMAVGEGYGGLEHRSSTSLLCSRNDLPRADQTEMSEEYRTFLGLCSHEYFHTWNVKRIKPAAFVPYDLSREVHTPLLWAFEGITSYYDDLALVRTGLISHKDYLELLGQTITRVLRTPGRFKQSVADSSFDAWTKFYKADENAPNAIVSYYAKGAVVALALDLTIREHSGSARSLDDLMRALWERHGRVGKGVNEDDLEQLAADIAGTDLGSFFDTYVRGIQDPDLAALLAPLGVDMHLRPAESAADKGGKPAKDEAKSARQVSLGVRTTDDALGARLLNVYEGGAAQQAGLCPGDVLVAIDGLRASHGNLEKRLAAYHAGEPVIVHAFRRDELRLAEVRLQSPPADTCYLILREDVEDAVRRRRAAWLGAN
jgi:predicted metalloprotease with PDZ domain